MSDSKELGVKATNHAFRQFDQVQKDQKYQLAEGQGEEEFDTEFEIKSCDMQEFLAGAPNADAAFAQELGSALEEIGFAVLTGHGIDPEIVQQANDAIRKFFETIPESRRLEFLAARHGSVNQGYFPIKETTIIHPGLVEGWVFCRRAFDMDDRPEFEPELFWPEPRYEPLFRQLCQTHEQLILPLMQSLLRYLECDPHSYDQKLTATNFGFRMNYYPALTDDDLRSGAGRMLGHEDVDLFTFLPAHDLKGLQVLNRRNMKWIRLDPPRGSIVINTGDYMQRITNDRLPSTTHRVSIPRDERRRAQPRISFPMAVYVWENTLLEGLPELGPAKYPPISAIEFHTRTTSKYYGADYAVDGSP
jgi:isopenicillin N synthase-like dioxygenase